MANEVISLRLSCEKQLDFSFIWCQPIDTLMLLRIIIVCTLTATFGSTDKTLELVG